MNIVVLIGRLTADPELRTTQSGRSVCSFTVAVDRRFKTPGQPDADFIRVVAWQRQAELISQYLTKGSQIAIQGRMQTGSYQDKNNITHYTTDVVLESFDFIGSRNSSGTGNYNQNQQPSYNSSQYNTGYHEQENTPLEIDDDFSLLSEDDDVPF